MKASLLERLDRLVERHEEVTALLGEPDVIADQERFKTLSREYARLDTVVKDVKRYHEIKQSLQDMSELLDDPDPEMRILAEAEQPGLDRSLEALESALQVHLLPDDPHDAANIFLEIRAGTGGDEAAIFAGDLLRMYLRFAERQRWSSEVLSERSGEHGGFKEVVVRLTGDRVYSHLKFESGVHRVQRVPDTESQGRVHTSAATVAILPELPETEAVTINTAELRIDTYRASGAGGQHVNKTDSAIRITHLPSGIVVECQDERSQHKNRARALALLQARLNNIEQERAREAESSSRKLQVGSGDRSERIRTYNFPQGRLTDHRIGLTLYRLDQIMEGDLDEVLDALRTEHQAEQLAELGEV